MTSENPSPLEEFRGWSKVGIFEQNRKAIYFFIVLALGIGLWFIPHPQAVTPQAWHLFAIFIATILGVILKPFPMGATVLLSIVITILTGTLTFDQAFSGYTNPTVWLIAFAFFIARGFILTGLGNRVAYIFVGLMGRTTLGLGYGVILSDLILAPTIPSTTARSGGVVFPIIKSLTQAFGSTPEENSSRKMGAFLVVCGFQGSVITSAMFMTAMAGNPLVAQLASDVGISISWTLWAVSALVPGLISLMVVPYVIYKLYPPEIKATPHAKQFAKEKLKEMGSVQPKEWLMLFTFGLLLVLWIFGSNFGVSPTVAAMVGLSVLILTGVLKWKDVLDEKGAWDTFFWFAILVTMASYLNKLGFISWISDSVTGHVQGFSWEVGFLILSLLYFYSHYFFASNIAHIGAMYAPFLIVALAVGVPPQLAALSFAFYSSLFGGISHYGCGPAPIMYGANYVPVGKWWTVGGVVSVINLTIWIGIGGLWWKILGLW